ncbi:MAG: sulfide/dihydroorotate dehydrogenase-like FAD/NAD-binding protein [Bacillota bacterium]|nr:sulfide/dihydroorotate dehydrogenase-like FAD/NAD-binding protein [Bacillota bacterium]
MEYEIKDCIDAGTEYCPCHLAETGDCLLCSQLAGKNFCDCINWKGVCIYQEYIWNGGKSKEERKNYICEIYKKENIFKNVILLTIRVKHELAQNLIHPGSYVFLRDINSNQYFDFPISIMDTDLEENTITLAIEIKGVKTKKFNLLKEGEKIDIRGPYWNGELGLKNIYNSRDGKSILIARGIGQAPLVPVLKKLYSNGNKTTVIIDNADYDKSFIDEYLTMCNSKVIECSTLNKGELSLELINILNNEINDENINLVHCSGPDILIFKTLEFINDKIAFSCCNNAKMCCGEGVCGACTVRYQGHIIKKLCKIQSDPKYIFKGRRFL